MMAKIRIDKEKCPCPQDCAKCMQACPTALFVLYPKKREIGKVDTDFELVVPAPSLCTSCGLCVEACPNEAIGIL